MLGFGENLGFVRPESFPQVCWTTSRFWKLSVGVPEPVSTFPRIVIVLESNIDCVRRFLADITLPFPIHGRIVRAAHRTFDDLAHMPMLAFRRRAGSDGTHRLNGFGLVHYCSRTLGVAKRKPVSVPELVCHVSWNAPSRSKLREARARRVG